MLTEAELKKPLSEMTAKEYLRQALLIKIDTDINTDRQMSEMLTQIARSAKNSALDLYKDLMGSDKPSQVKSRPSRLTTTNSSGSL